MVYSDYSISSVVKRSSVSISGVISSGGLRSSEVKDLLIVGSVVVRNHFLSPIDPRLSPDFAFGATENTKNFIAQLHRETVAPATPIFWPIPYIGKMSKNAF